MKTHLFNYSLLATGIAAVLCISSTANAATSGSTTTTIDITNQASATYHVSNQAQPPVKSNIVKIVVSEQVSFSLVAQNDDSEVGGTQGDDANIKQEVAPNGFASFKHTLTNTGNRTDTYTITLDGTPDRYDVVNSNVSYVIYAEDGTVISSQANMDYSSANGQAFPLEKGQYIDFTINAKTTGNKGGSTQTLQISATSASLAANSTASTSSLTNTNSSFTKLPTFEIVKTITNALDLNDINDTATYKLVVNNDGNTAFNADATDITITDMLPPGLVLAEALSSANITSSGQATKGVIDTGNAGDTGFNITGINIPVGQNITIVFKVKQDGSGALNPTTAINHAKVTDDLDDNPLTENILIDSTDSSIENVSTFYSTDDTDNLNGEISTGAGDDSTMPLLTIKRSLSLSGVTTKEIAPTSGTLGQVTHQTVITNKGQDVEGDTAGELTFTITDDDGNTPDAISVVSSNVTITYDADGTGNIATGEPIPISPTLKNGVSVYDIHTALPGGIATNGTVTINYKVESIKAPLFTPVNSTTPTFENTVVTLTPKLEGAPTPVAVTDTTTVKGLTLDKFQALDVNCDGIISGAGEIDFTDDKIEQAEPGQCVIYRIDAKNTSSAAPLGFDITDVVILDELAEFSANADYVDNSATTTFANGTATNNGTAITTTIATLAPQATETMQFKVKIKTAR